MSAGVGYEVDVPMSTFYNLPARRARGAADPPQSSVVARISCSAF